MVVARALEFFTRGDVLNVLKATRDVSFHGLSLGQRLSTMLGGECQRLRHAGELHKRAAFTSWTSQRSSWPCPTSPVCCRSSGLTSTTSKTRTGYPNYDLRVAARAPLSPRNRRLVLSHPKISRGSFATAYAVRQRYVSSRRYSGRLGACAEPEPMRAGPAAVPQQRRSVDCVLLPFHRAAR